MVCWGYPSVIAVLSSILAYSLAIPATECNDHGVLMANSTQLCECESPYIGNHCQYCSNGYYGDPRGGMPCYLSCTHTRLLTQFTTAGLGVTRDFLLNNPPENPDNRPFCLWIIAPSLNSQNYTFDKSNATSDSENTLPPGFTNTEAPYSVNYTMKNDSSNQFTFSLQFNSSIIASPDCFAESVLIYNGLPNFLHFSHPDSFFNFSSNISSFNSNFTNKLLNETEDTMSSYSNGSLNPATNLIASFNGEQLIDSSLIVTSSILTVVYLYHGVNMQEQSTLDSSPNGFNLTVHVTEVSGLEESLNGSIPSCNQTGLSLTGLNCMGRYWHSSVYASSTDSLWLYGGLDLSGVMCAGVLVLDVSRLMVAMEMGCEGGDSGVRLVAPSDVREWPASRHLHSAVHLSCPNTEENKGCLLVFGGFPSADTRQDPSIDLWVFDGSSENWTRLADAPVGFGLAAHAAVMVGNSTMLAIGGVRGGLTISAQVVSYDVLNDSWEVWERETLGLPGVYGHTAVYDSETDLVYLFGGVAYSRPSAAISSSLYVLDVQRRHWAKVLLATNLKPIGVMFHSMVLVNHTLVIYGGLVRGDPLPTASSSGLDSICPSNHIILIDLDSDCNGKAVISINSSTKLWGHSASADSRNQIYIAGGFNGTAVDSVFVLQALVPVTCSIVQTTAQCLSLSGCAVCSHNDNFLGCYNVSETNQSLVCEGSNQHSQPSPYSCSQLDADATCARFSDCEECLTSDVAQDLGCVWCDCDVDRCTNSCSCENVARNYTDVKSECPLDFCSSPSCQDCLNNDLCGWTFIQITRTSVDQSSIRISPDAVEWGCYYNPINALITDRLGYVTTLGVCPLPCSEAKTCKDCVQALNPHGGALRCVWSSYSQTCSTPDLLPLLCSTGLCGSVITTQEQCPLPCTSHTDCDSCLHNPVCVWYGEYSEFQAFGFCTDAFTWTSNLTEVTLDRGVSNVQVYYLKCLTCLNDCGSHGVCVLSDLSCSCDLGYTGENCSVKCECNGLSYCANDTEAGRRHCLQCQQNTQGPSCNECKPFFIGAPSNGTGCVPCSVHCYGNSEICARKDELEEALNGTIPLNTTELETVISSGPNDTEAVCVSCEGYSSGDRCETCQNGYYSNPDTSTVTCTECLCNGHGNCDPGTGVCSCQNNTRSTVCRDGIPCSTRIQCNQCLTGYVGSPANSNQCYSQLSINTVQNFTLFAKQSLALAVGLDYFVSDVDVTVTFVLEYGSLQIYEALSSSAVYVEVNEDTFEDTVTVRPGFGLTTRTRREAESDSIFQLPKQSDIDRSKVKSKEDTSFIKMISSRQVSSEPVIDQSGVVLHNVVSNRYSFVIPHSDINFHSSRHYLTIFASRPTGARFFIYYRQDSPEPNYFVYFGVLMSSFVLALSLGLVMWKLYKVGKARRDRIRARHLEELRGNRPYAKVHVYFATRKKKTEQSKVAFKKVPLMELAGDALPSLSVRPQPDRLSGVFDQGPHQEIELQSSSHKSTLKQSGSNAPQNPKSKKKALHKKVPVNVEDILPWPIAREPIAREGATVSTLIIKLPTIHKATRAHMISFGSCLVLDQKVDEGKKHKKRFNLRRNQCVPVTSDGLEVATEL